MAKTSPQSFAHHARTDPAYHFLLSALVLAALILAIIILVRHPSLEATALIVVVLALLVNTGLTRSYPLKVQDRVIRLEERLRLALLLPEAQRPRIKELTGQQLIGLRFASDDELPELAMRAVNEGLSSKQIKAAIVSWRDDHTRV
jgi:Family of unknown function (DUF6526)